MSEQYGGTAYTMVDVYNAVTGNFVGTTWTGNTTTNYTLNFTTSTGIAPLAIYVAVDREGSGWGSYLESNVVYAAPNAPTNFVATRNSDSKNTLTWTNNSTAARLWQNIYLQRSVDGGTYADLKTLAGTVTSYADTTTQANHNYKYRIKAQNNYKSTDWIVSSVLYNTPSAPGTPTASRVSAGNVQVTFANPGLTETSLEWQRSTDGSTWGASTAITGTDVKSFTDSPGSGTFYYRVRNLRGSLASAWSATSNGVVSMVAPAAPTLTAPASGAVVNASLTPTRLAWTHNPIDGSAQTAAQVRLSTDGGTTWTETIQVTGDAQSIDHDTDWDINATVTWQARTKGAHADYGPWSALRTFRVYQVPQVAITAPESPVADVPITVAWDYSDESGTQIQVEVSILNEAGVALFARVIQGDATETIVSVDDILLGNNATYTVQVIVTSSSTLTATSNMSFDVAYEEPEPPGAEITVDDTLGTVTLLVNEGTPEVLPYLSVDGAGWNTGIEITPTLTIRMVARIVPDSAIGILFGGMGSSYGTLSDPLYISKTQYRHGQPGSTSLALPENEILNIEYADDGTLHINDVTYTPTGTFSGMTPYSSVGLADGWLNAPGMASQFTGNPFTGDIASFSISEGDTLLADYIPVQEGDTTYGDPAPEDCFWDSVSGEYKVKAKGEATWHPGESDVPDTASLGVFRQRPDGTLLSLGTGLSTSAEVVDPYPPLDQELTYIIAAYTDNGLASQSVYHARVDSKGAVFINFGDGLGEVAKVVLDRKIDWGKKHDVALLPTAGDNPAPLAFYGRSEELTGSISGTIYRDEVGWPTNDDPSAYDNLKAASDWLGPVVLRRPAGSVMPANVELSFSDGLSKSVMTASLSFQRVRGHGLVI
jgi:hypothetical protein